MLWYSKESSHSETILLWGVLTADLSTSIKLDHACGREMISLGLPWVPSGLQRTTLVGSGRGFYTDVFDMSKKSV